MTSPPRSTAYTVAQLPGSLFKFYFVQDFEPEFYQETDPLYRKAEATYELPMQMVCVRQDVYAKLAVDGGV